MPCRIFWAKILSIYSLSGHSWIPLYCAALSRALCSCSIKRYIVMHNAQMRRHTLCCNARDMNYFIISKYSLLLELMPILLVFTPIDRQVVFVYRVPTSLTDRGLLFSSVSCADRRSHISYSKYWWQGRITNFFILFTLQLSRAQVVLL